MAWEYKIVEPIDYGHPGGSVPRYDEFAKELTKLCSEGWEVVQMVPSMMRGRLTAGAKDDMVSMTAVALIALLRRNVE
jgi:hypothetical protein